MAEMTLVGLAGWQMLTVINYEGNHALVFIELVPFDHQEYWSKQLYAS